MNADAGWEELFTLDELLAVHRAEMERRRSSTRIKIEGCVEGALGTSWLAEKYVAADIPDTVPGLVFSCWALRALARNHCLFDGNKRLAWFAFTLGLAALGLTVEASTDEAEAFVKRVITEHLEGAAVLAWAQSRLAVLGA